jgi:choline dehydrogenase-like flavoprotein
VEGADVNDAAERPSRPPPRWEDRRTQTCNTPSLGSFKGTRSGNSSRRQRRRMADAAPVARLCRGQVESPGDMPLGGTRPARHRPRLAICRRIFDAPALKQFVREEALPEAQIQTDDELLDARRDAGTCYHASCTCMMGSHPMSVVDSELRVHGIDGLRVIDASVMPAVTSTNTKAPTIMTAEKGAALIRGAAGGVAA